MYAQSWMPLALSCAFVFVGQARATTITGHMTADNLFSFYVSTDDAVAGTLVGSGNDWSASYTLSAELTPGVTNYIHVQATDQGSPQGFIGDFSLSDGGFQFANGTQLLLTTPAQWSLSFTGFGQNYESSITSVGMNGVGPWGAHPPINASAEWLDFHGSSSSNYFSAPISPVPEPTMLALAGLSVVAMRRRRG